MRLPISQATGGHKSQTGSDTTLVVTSAPHPTHLQRGVPHEHIHTHQHKEKERETKLTKLAEKKVKTPTDPNDN